MGRRITLLSGLEEVLWRHYGLYGPFEPLELAAEGHNNTLVALRSPAGSFVWKRSESVLSPAQRREFTLLAWLDFHPLPFRVAAPLRTREGAWGWEEDGLNVLFPLLPGERLPETPVAWQALGAAQRALHDTLAQYPTQEAPWPLDWASLDRLHPRVADPLTLSRERPDLWGDKTTLTAWQAALQETRRLVQGEYARLPRQVIHGDFNSVNVLFGGKEVTAVLDFEFACLGPRELDVATALSDVLMRAEPGWPLAEAFLLGYGPLERAALPAALLLRQAAVGVWGLGQALDNGANATTHARLRALVTVQAWLAVHQARLVTG